MIYLTGRYESHKTFLPISEIIPTHPSAFWCSTLQWHNNGRDGVSNPQRPDSLLNGLFRHRSKKTSKLRVIGLWEGNSPGIGEFPTQKASNAENVSIWWRHHEFWIGDDAMYDSDHVVATYIDECELIECYICSAKKWLRIPVNCVLILKVWDKGYRKRCWFKSQNMFGHFLQKPQFEIIRITSGSMSLGETQINVLVSLGDQLWAHAVSPTTWYDWMTYFISRYASGKAFVYFPWPEKKNTHFLFKCRCWNFVRHVLLSVSETLSWFYSAVIWWCKLPVESAGDVAKLTWPNIMPLERRNDPILRPPYIHFDGKFKVFQGGMTWYVSMQGSFWLWAQLMRDDVTM